MRLRRCRKVAGSQSTSIERCSRFQRFHAGDSQQTATWKYDALDRKIERQHPDANKLQASYGLSTIPGGFEKTTVHDELNRPVTVHTDAWGRTIRVEKGDCPLFSAPKGTIVDQVPDPETEKRLQRPKAGDVFQIPLGDGAYGFAQLCWKGRDCAFFDLKSGTVPSIDEIIANPVIFRTTVEQTILRSGRWPIIGNRPLAGALAEPASYRTQPIGSNQLYLYRAGERYKATLEEVKNLESLVIWLEEHIVKRLLDHFAGRPNRSVEYFRKIRRYGPDGQQVDQE